VIKVGIDAIAFYTPRYALDLATLAESRGVPVDKFYVGLGQQKMSVVPPGEDIVTMAANACRQALLGIDVNQIDMLLFATESAADLSKAAGIYLHHLLELPARCRVLELKQACYSGTGAMQLALPYLRENPDKKVLVVTSDIARYALTSAAESSQGAGAVAMVISTEPRLLSFESVSGFVTEDVMDFWRPVYLSEPIVEGKYSSKLYLAMLEKTWKEYSLLSGHGFSDHAAFCYHTPVPRLVEKAHQLLMKMDSKNLSHESSSLFLEDSLLYSRQMGNCYSASLFLSLASLLDNSYANLSNERIGFYSYGSGCVAEYFSGLVTPNYHNYLNSDYHQALLTSRQILNYEQYEMFYHFAYPTDGSDIEIPRYATGHYRLKAMSSHKRIYEKVLPKLVSITETNNEKINHIAQGRA
jgi:hydroxymethylglutaryl-CoA synthase